MPQQNSGSCGGARRVGAVARQTLRAALHLRVAWVLSAGIVAILSLPLALREFSFGVMELKFLTDFGFSAIALGTSLLAVLVTAHLYFDDLENGMMASVLTRAITRVEYLGGKIVGVAALLAMGVVALTFTLGVVLAIRLEQLGVRVGMPHHVLGQAALLTWGKATLIASMTLVVCCSTRSALFASCVGLMLVVVGQLRPFTAAEGWLGWLRFWPDLTLFDAEHVLTGARHLGWKTGAQLAGYWFLFVMGLGGVATYVFRQREF